MEHNSIAFAEMEEFFDLLPQQEVIDVIDTFFRFGPKSFYIIGRTKGREYGMHQFDPMSSRHVITVDPSKIIKCFDRQGRLGGNQHAPTLKAACVMVLCHELTHANQHYSHTGRNGFDAGFYGVNASGKVIPFKTYMGRPCEVDARRTVDESMHIIRAMCGLPDMVDRSLRIVDDSEVFSVAESFYDLETVLVADIVDELRRSKLNNAINVGKIIDFLEGNGVEVL